jgi:hypothetical protein
MISSLPKGCSLLGNEDSRSNSFSITNTSVGNDDMFGSSMGAIFSGGLSRDIFSEDLLSGGGLSLCSHSNVSKPVACTTVKPQVNSPPKENCCPLPIKAENFTSQGQPLPQTSFTNVLEGHSQTSVTKLEQAHRPAQFQGAVLFNARASQISFGSVAHIASGAAGNANLDTSKKRKRNQNLEGDNRLQGTWTAEENNLFFNALRLFGRTFDMLHEAMRGSKSREQVCTLKSVILCFRIKSSNSKN